MPTDEVRAAAKRLRLYYTTSDLSAIYGGSLDKRDDDEQVLARAYLAGQSQAKDDGLQDAAINVQQTGDDEFTVSIHWMSGRGGDFIRLKRDNFKKVVGKCEALLGMSAQSHPVSERLLAAAKIALDSLDASGDAATAFVAGDRKEERDARMRITATTVLLENAIAAAEAEQVERSLPVTKEWLLSLGLQHENKLSFPARPGYELTLRFPNTFGQGDRLVLEWDAGYWSLNCRSQPAMILNTRGAVLDLIRILGAT